MAELRHSPDFERRIAMLMDGDNAQYKLIEPMLEEVSRYGIVTIRRAYGDWTEPNLAYWREPMLAHAIQPIQQWRYTTGKNATDSALIIDAMDILYSGTVHGFCIVSSDSDYTRLCVRIREAGLFVMGLGRKITPKSFVKACEVFVYVENLDQDPVNLLPNGTQSEPVTGGTPDQQVVVPHDAKPTTSLATESTAPVAPKPATSGMAKPTISGTAKPTVPATTKLSAPLTTEKETQSLLNLLHRACDLAVEENGWVHLGKLGQALRRLDPSFDSRTYGYKNLSLLIQSFPNHFLIQGLKAKGTSTVHIQLKENVQEVAKPSSKKIKKSPPAG